MSNWRSPAQSNHSSVFVHNGVNVNHIFPLSSSIVAGWWADKRQVLSLPGSSLKCSWCSHCEHSYGHFLEAYRRSLLPCLISVALQDKSELQNWLVLSDTSLHPPSRDFFVDILCSDDNVKWVIKLTEAIQGTQIIWIISSALTKFDSKHKYRSQSLKLGCWVGNTVATDYRQTQSQFYYQTLNRNKL